MVSWIEGSERSKLKIKNIHDYLGFYLHDAKQEGRKVKGLILESFGAGTFLSKVWGCGFCDLFSRRVKRSIKSCRGRLSSRPD